jgi:hypothetical protein
MKMTMLRKTWLPVSIFLNASCNYFPHEKTEEVLRLNRLEFRAFWQWESILQYVKCFIDFYQNKTTRVSSRLHKINFIPLRINNIMDLYTSLRGGSAVSAGCVQGSVQPVSVGLFHIHDRKCAYQIERWRQKERGEEIKKIGRKKDEVKLSRYTPWRRLGGEEI